MGIRTAVVTVLTSGLVAGALLAAPAEAAQSTGWNSVSLDMLKSVVKSINADAKANKRAQHAPGCYQVLALKGHSNFVAVNVRRTNTTGCGSAMKFGIRAYRKSGSKWVFVGGPSGGPGSACVYEKAATARDKSLMKSSGMCR